MYFEKKYTFLAGKISQIYHFASCKEVINLFIVTFGTTISNAF